MSRFVKRRYLRNTSLSRTQRILQAKLVGQVATHKACTQAAILDNLYYFDFGCLTKRHMKFYTPSGDILSSTIKPLNTMTRTNTENIRRERIAIVTRMSITKLADAILNDKNYFSLPFEAINELEKFAAIFNYKQSARSKYDGISYLRDFYYYLCA